MKGIVTMPPSIETANVGKAVAARVGTNIREVRLHPNSQFPTSLL